MNNNFRNENVILVIMLPIMVIIFFFPIVNSCMDANKYENISPSKVKSIDFYEYVSYRKKGRLLLSIKDRKKLNEFFKYYWKDFHIYMSKSSGGYRCIIEIKADNRNILLYLEMNSNKYVRMSDGGSIYFKSYKLYNFLKTIRKKDKELKKKDANIVKN